MLVPLFFLLVTIALSLTAGVMYAITMLSTNGEPTEQKLILVNTIDVSAIALSMVTNLLATLLIAYKLWSHRKLTSNLGLQKQRSHVQNVLFLLVESGVFFLVIQLTTVFIIFFNDGPAAGYAHAIVGTLYLEFAAMYPALILVIVNKQRSIVNTFGINTTLGSNLNVEGHAKSTKHHPATTRDFVFASPSVNSTVDHEQSLYSGFPGGPRSSDSHMA